MAQVGGFGGFLRGEKAGRREGAVDLAPLAVATGGAGSLHDLDHVIGVLQLLNAKDPVTGADLKRDSFGV